MPLAFSRRRQRIVPLLRTPRRSGAGRGTPRAAASLPRGATAAPRTAGPRAHRGLPAPPGDPQRAAAAQPQHVRGWKQGEGRTEPPAARAAGRKRPRAAQRERGAAPGAAASAANLRALASRRPAQLRAVPAPTCGGPHLHVGSPLLSLHPVRRPSLPVPHFSLGRARAGAAPGAGAVTPPQPRREDVAQRRAVPPCPPSGLSPCVAGLALFPRGAAADPASASPAAAAPRLPAPPARRAGLTRGAAPPRPTPPRRGGRGGEAAPARPGPAQPGAAWGRLPPAAAPPSRVGRPVTAAPSSHRPLARCRGAGAALGMGRRGERAGEASRSGPQLRGSRERPGPAERARLLVEGVTRRPAREG